MRRVRPLIAGTVGIACLAVLGVACGKGLPEAGREEADAPNVWRLVIEIDEQGARLLSKKPSRRRVPSEAELETSFRELAADIDAGRVYLVEYVASGPSGEYTGRFVVSRQSYAESRDPRTGQTRASSAPVVRSVFRTAIPFRADIETVELTRLRTLDPGAEEKAEERIPLGTLRMDSVQ